MFCYGIAPERASNDIYFLFHYSSQICSKRYIIVLTHFLKSCRSFWKDASFFPVALQKLIYFRFKGGEP